MPASQPILFAGEDLILLPDRAVYWPARQTLILADVHLGKDAAFRTSGLPVPAGNSAKDLSRITRLLDETRAARLVILGDLVHARASHQPELAAAFQQWRNTTGVPILLIRGNHDQRAGLTPADWRIDEVSEPYPDGPLTYAHHPQPIDLPHLCGHLHPTLRLRDFDRSAVSLPCFVIDPTTLMLPSFGSFTGGCQVERSPARKIYAAAGSKVIRVQ